MEKKDLNIFEKMRGIYTPVTEIRRKVLAAVARMVVEDQPPRYIEYIPYQIIDKNIPTYRESVFKERAIVRERIRLAFGMELKEFGAHGPIHDDDVINTITDLKVLKRPIVNVIKAGCERCPEDSYIVTNLCQGCIAHPCTSVCPKNAVSIQKGKSLIDQLKCIRCGRCAQVCPYNAIAYRERPCATACGVKAISSDEYGFADINYNLCVSCGMCIVSCPFGAIGEKSEIVQIISAIKNGKRVYAEIAPAFVNQFGPLASSAKIRSALKEIGFLDIKEVALGADKVILKEAKELVAILENDNKKNISKDEKQFIGTSCCTSWKMCADRHFPELAKNNISESFAPMVETARVIKEKDPDAIVVFIGPCIAKKEECFIPEVTALVDFVMTFEELVAVFQAFEIDPIEFEEEEPMQDASCIGRNFPVAGGVAQAIIKQTRALLPENKKDREIPHINADTLAKCLTMLKKLKSGKFNPKPLVVEGMACPFGCIGGPGSISSLNRAKNAVKKFAEKAKNALPSDYLKKK
ncbi:MAG: 4Fe-4S dicluster domain-containing protein [Candidatus Lokiarchaeota archaeon]|nr:4Fe-4S dicluster domain-containing protein [Candidatus Lokiarchaeota archaeon]